MREIAAGTTVSIVWFGGLTPLERSGVGLGKNKLLCLQRVLHAIEFLLQQFVRELLNRQLVGKLFAHLLQYFRRAEVGHLLGVRDLDAQLRLHKVVDTLWVNPVDALCDGIGIRVRSRFRSRSRVRCLLYLCLCVSSKRKIDWHAWRGRYRVFGRLFVFVVGDLANAQQASGGAVPPLQFALRFATAREVSTDPCDPRPVSFGIRRVEGEVTQRVLNLQGTR